MNTTHTLEIQMDGLLLNFIMLIWQCCGYFSGIRLNGGTRTPSTMSIASTTTSHGSVDWQSTEVNKDGKTFKQSVVFHFLSNNLHLRIFSLGVFIWLIIIFLWILICHLRDTCYIPQRYLICHLRDTCYAHQRYLICHLRDTCYVPQRYFICYLRDTCYAPQRYLICHLRDTCYVPQRYLICTSEILVAINLMSSEDFPENVGESHHCKNLKFKNFGESQLKLVSPWLI